MLPDVLLIFLCVATARQALEAAVIENNNLKDQLEAMQRTLAALPKLRPREAADRTSPRELDPELEPEVQIEIEASSPMPQHQSQSASYYRPQPPKSRSPSARTPPSSRTPPQQQQPQPHKKQEQQQQQQRQEQSVKQEPREPPAAQRPPSQLAVRTQLPVRPEPPAAKPTQTPFMSSFAAPEHSAKQGSFSYSVTNEAISPIHPATAAAGAASAPDSRSQPPQSQLQQDAGRRDVDDLRMRVLQARMQQALQMQRHIESQPAAPAAEPSPAMPPPPPRSQQMRTAAATTAAAAATAGGPKPSASLASGSETVSASLRSGRPLMEESSFHRDQQTHQPAHPSHAVDGLNSSVYSVSSTYSYSSIATARGGALNGSVVQLVKSRVTNQDLLEPDQ